MKLYCAYEKDKYELPVAIEVNLRTLAKKLGVKEGTVKSYLTPSQKDKGKYKIVKMEVEEWY